MNHPENTMASFLTCLFDAWNKAEIRYLVLRNYEELPEHTGNDVDILLDPKQLTDVQKVLKQLTGDSGWKIHNIGEFACRAIYLFNEDTLEQVHIDFMCGLKWHMFYFVDDEIPLNARQPFKNFYKPDPVHEAVVNLMTRLIYGGYVKEKYREGIRHSALNNREGLEKVLVPWVGHSLAEFMVESAQADDWPGIEEQVFKVRKQVLLTNLKHPMRLVASLASDVLRFLRRSLHSPGISVVFFGPDGCGKTSVAEGLQQALVKTYYVEKSMHCHWKPLPPKGGPCAPTEDPHALPPRNKLLSTLYFFYHYLPFIWGWWRYVKPVLFRNGLVIIDRYYYDFFVDQRRYRLRLPQWIVKLGFIFVKKPELVFCLDAEPEILQARKAEVSFDECRRQREAYRDLAEKLPNGHVIDASQSLDKVVFDVQNIMLDFMAERAAKRVRQGSHEKHTRSEADSKSRQRSGKGARKEDVRL